MIGAFASLLASIARINFPFADQSSRTRYTFTFSPMLSGPASFCPRMNSPWRHKTPHSQRIRLLRQLPEMNRAEPRWKK
jgi:hypothetical protein